MLAQNLANAKIEIVKINGKCGMREKTFEKIATQMGIVVADWDMVT